MAMGCNLSYTSVSLPCPPDHETTEGDGCFSDINQDIDID
eukprot:CAMPEP_0175970038 /NCGR_PEP_ID=MMETSP0108-20121206/40814_1 /TAXON_ID=195067 ORGANISM="Goniomonas pacifica, Strain CCMP1869" /NCGR_SAMPLE_ID=MMETSP0108 /ASSEMBLY_ACC=CAM_ASM_000204 /LENGTH=39 /DNA_ID= /DNA_START= /DNA_END= /DNA_ORIENTATION=